MGIKSFFYSRKAAKNCAAFDLDPSERRTLFIDAPGFPWWLRDYRNRCYDVTHLPSLYSVAADVFSLFRTLGFEPALIFDGSVGAASHFAKAMTGDERSRNRRNGDGPDSDPSAWRALFSDNSICDEKIDHDLNHSVALDAVKKAAQDAGLVAVETGNEADSTIAWLAREAARDSSTPIYIMSNDNDTLLIPGAYVTKPHDVQRALKEYLRSKEERSEPSTATVATTAPDGEHLDETVTDDSGKDELGRHTDTSTDAEHEHKLAVTFTKTSALHEDIVSSADRFLSDEDFVGEALHGPYAAEKDTKAAFRGAQTKQNALVDSLCALPHSKKPTVVARAVAIRANIKAAREACTAARVAHDAAYKEVQRFRGQLFSRAAAALPALAAVTSCDFLQCSRIFAEGVRDDDDPSAIRRVQCQNEVEAYWARFIESRGPRAGLWLRLANNRKGAHSHGATSSPKSPLKEGAGSGAGCPLLFATAWYLWVSRREGADAADAKLEALVTAEPAAVYAREHLAGGLAPLEVDEALFKNGIDETHHLRFSINAVGAALGVLPDVGGDAAEVAARRRATEALIPFASRADPLSHIRHVGDDALPLAGTREPCATALLASLKTREHAYISATPSLLALAATSDDDALEAAAVLATRRKPGRHVEPSAIYAVGTRAAHPAGVVAVERTLPVLLWEHSPQGADTSDAKKCVRDLVCDLSVPERQQHALSIAGILVSDRAGEGLGEHAWPVGKGGADISIPTQVLDVSFVALPGRALNAVDAIVCALRHVVAYTVDLVRRVGVEAAPFTPKRVAGVHPAAYLPTRAELRRLAAAALADLNQTPEEIVAAASVPDLGGRVARAAAPSMFCVERALQRADGAPTLPPPLDVTGAELAPVAEGRTRPKPRQSQLAAWFTSVLDKIESIFDDFEVTIDGDFSSIFQAESDAEALALAADLKLLVCGGAAAVAARKRIVACYEDDDEDGGNGNCYSGDDEEEEKDVDAMPTRAGLLEHYFVADGRFADALDTKRVDVTSGARVACCKPLQEVLDDDGATAEAVDAIYKAAVAPFSSEELDAVYDTVAQTVADNGGYVYYSMVGPGVPDDVIDDDLGDVARQFDGLHVRDAPLGRVATVDTHPSDVVGAQLARAYLRHRGIASAYRVDALERATGHSHGTLVKFDVAAFDASEVLLRAAAGAGE